MINFTDKEPNRRLTALHPKARRELARMTDSTYRAHNIAKPQTPYLFGLHPMAFIVPSVLALVLMLKDAIGALI